MHHVSQLYFRVAAMLDTRKERCLSCKATMSHDCSQVPKPYIVKPLRAPRLPVSSKLLASLPFLKLWMILCGLVL